MVEGVERDVDQSVDRARGTVARNADFVKGVDGGLNDYIREGEKAALNSRGNADLYDLHHKVG